MISANELRQLSTNAAKEINHRYIMCIDLDNISKIITERATMGLFYANIYPEDIAYDIGRFSKDNPGFSFYFTKYQSALRDLLVGYTVNLIPFQATLRIKTHIKISWETE